MYGPHMRAEYLSKSGEKIILELRPPLDEGREAKKFVAWFNDNRVRQYLSMNCGLSESGETEWIRGQNQKQDDLVWFAYVSNEPVGSIGLHKIDRENQHAELGINIGNRDYWGKGIATAMEILVLEYAFENLVAGGLHKVIARVISGNHASQKIQEQKIGFRTVGTTREEVWSNGSWHDIWVGEMLASKWRKEKSGVMKNAGITSFELYPGCD